MTKRHFDSTAKKRQVMREKWEAAQANLRAQLEKDDNYVHFLESVEKELARKLRFARRSRSGTLLDNIAFDRFVEATAQLKYLHTFYQGKLKLIVDPIDDENACSFDGKCDVLVETLEDMLSILRIVYGQLFSRRDATNTALQIAFEKGKNEWDGELLEKYLQSQFLTVDELVARPLNRFDELIQFVKALSVTFSKAKENDIARNGCNAGNTKGTDRAARLKYVVQESERYIHLIELGAQDEKVLIALQTCFNGDGANNFNDLSNNKLLLCGEVSLSHANARSGSSHPCLQADTGLFSQSNQIDTHCFQDGTLVCSKRRTTGSDESSTILYCLQLKQDAVFLEHVPTSVSMFKSSDEARGFALIRRDTILVLTWKDALESQRWADTVGGFLENNGSRTEVLHQGRLVSELPLRKEVSVQLVNKDTMPTKFASFYDDHLPGVFWMAPRSNSSSPQWELVDVVLYARWLLVFKLEGWNQHTALFDFDTHSPNLEIGERVRGEKEWSLVITDESVGEIILVSTKRTRIDFWFDQVSKALESAHAVAQRAEREKEGCLVTDEREIHHDRIITESTLKKRKEFRHFVQSRMASQYEEAPFITGSTGSTASNLRDSQDSKQGELVPSPRDVKGRSNDTPLSKIPRRSCIKSTDAPAIAIRKKNVALVAISSPTLKTPKRKWLKRKAEDQGDTALMPTQLSPRIPADQPISEIDTTQLSVSTQSAGHGSKVLEVRIVLTGIEPTASIRKKIGLIVGAVYEEDIEKATHVLAPRNQLKRTVKMLCGISRCAHVVDKRWLDESARVGASLSEREYCLKDAEAEGKWQFDLQKTMYDFTLEQRQKLFAGHQVFITNHKSILPPVKDLVKIVECAGGTAVANGSAGPTDVVISSETALATASARRALALANPARIYSSELILSSILQQHIDFTKNRLETTSCGSRRRK